jgi:hypothetical protein
MSEVEKEIHFKKLQFTNSSLKKRKSENAVHIIIDKQWLGLEPQWNRVTKG